MSHSNQLTKIQPFTFMPLVQLNLLGLGYNELVDLSDVNIFKGLDQIQEVLLG